MTSNSFPTDSYADERDSYLELDSETEADEQQPQTHTEPTSSDQDLLSQALSSIYVEKNDSKEQFYRASYKIFAKLRELFESNQSYMTQNSTTEDRDVIVTLSQFVEMTYDYTEAEKYTRMWDLCQRLYFPMENTHLLCSVGDWLNNYEPLPNAEEARAQDEDEDLEEHNAIGPTWIWEYARRHLLRGNFSESIDILTFALDFLDAQQKTAVTKVIELITELDDIVSNHLDNKTVFYEKWAAWRERSKARDSEYEFALDELDHRVPKNEEIWTLYSILVGDEEIISREGTYYEVVLGIAWFAKPQSSLSTLKSLAQHVQNTSDDDACSFLLMGRFDDAFDELGGDLWLHTHLGYALMITGHMETSSSSSSKVTTTSAIDKEDVIDPIYYSIQAYAQLIADEYDMLEEAIIYLSCCQSNKEIWIKQLLGDPILPSKDVDRVHALLDISERYGLNQVTKYMHKGLGHRFEKQHKIRQATVEYGKAHDLASLDRLAHHEFSGYLRSGTLGDVVTDMPSLHNSPHYAILIQYHNFRHHLSQQQWQEASKDVLLLLKNEHLPTKFETVLLIDILQILRESKHYFSAENVIQLINMFKLVANDASNQDFIAKYYKIIEKRELTSNIITAKIRERLAYKAATAPTAC
ncbi:Nup85 Nucleoporin [Mucor circinelloides 1006PhL]|uniref:Nuclear pore complex protein Nup85 n=1 Tax=Mucor circinelloides f. circinelloides (strain 1006PhL) TaxID=1220926 RepID=S2JC60_MUCC1|nr:Nup85 Nucleoporin [Mucor circinelloides 1006PhL]